MHTLKLPTAIVCVMALYVNMAFAILAPCCCQRSVEVLPSDVACEDGPIACPPKACPHCAKDCAQAETCCKPVEGSCDPTAPAVHCACHRVIPTFIQSVDTQKRLSVPASSDSLHPFLMAPSTACRDLSGLSDKSLQPVPIHGPPLLAFLCVWLN